MTASSATLEQAGDVLLEALLSAAVDGIVIIDHHANILMFSHGAQTLFGYTSEEVIGRNVKVLMPGPYQDEHDGYMTRYVETGEKRIIGIGREVAARHRDGTEFPIDLSVGEAPLGEHALFVGIMRDLRRRTRLEEALSAERALSGELERRLTHVQRVSTLGEMTAGIAHEINQPLSAISTYAGAGQRLIEQESPDIEKLTYALQCVADQARRAGDVVQRMRDLSRQTDTVREASSINAVLRDILVLIELETRETGAPIHLALASDLPLVAIDSVQIQQVVLNLVRNGLESMVLCSQADKGIVLATRQQDDTVVVSVTDHGEGVASGQRESIFNPFETTKPNGMGIGLSICTTIIQRHAGRLWHEPNPAGGSCFQFSLPIAEESQP